MKLKALLFILGYLRIYIYPNNITIDPKLTLIDFICISINLFIII